VVLEGVLVKACGEDGSCNDVEGCSGKKKVENSSQRNSRAQSGGQ
jgi:hypothetical protein